MPASIRQQHGTPTAQTFTDVLRPPAWCIELAGEPAPWSGLEGARGLPIQISRSIRGDATLVSALAVNAARTRPGEFRRLVAHMYGGVRRALEAAGAARPVRLWNLLPSIHAPMEDGLDRYMVFNEGRQNAYHRWLREEDRVAGAVPTASAVGHTGADLVVHCLALADGGTPVENPRQRPAYRYSSRYGRLPPCFARGTLVGLRGRRVLLLGGTASVRGEDTVHPYLLDRQLAETFENIASLLHAAGASHHPESLQLLREARVYVARQADIAQVRDAVAAQLPVSCRMETVRADICRPDLLAEIEGVAELEPAPDPERARG